MSRTIARMYANQDAADAAVNELRENAFTAEAMHAAPQPSAPAEESAPLDGAAATSHPAIDAMAHAGVSPEHAGVYAAAMQRGEVLVLVIDPLFGFGLAATEILEKHGPVAVDLPADAMVHGARTWDWHSPTPLSSWLGWRVLCNDPTPLSNYLKLPVTKVDPTPSRTLEAIRKQSDSPTPLSSKLGVAVLSDNPTPLSTKVGMRVLSDQAAPLSDRVGWRLGSDDPTPLSRLLGWRVLLDNPTPLSSALHWRVLSRRQ